LVPGVTTDDNHLTLVQENLQEFSKYAKMGVLFVFKAK
jgi:hypothetical protein